MSEHTVTWQRGPYCNEDGDWWVAVEDVPSYREARRQVEMCLDYDVPDDGTLPYRGKHVARLCDAAYQDIEHEVGPDCDDKCDRTVLAYHFEEHRKW